jgi:hypothetical protein
MQCVQRKADGEWDDDTIANISPFSLTDMTRLVQQQQTQLTVRTSHDL